MASRCEDGGDDDEEDGGYGDNPIDEPTLLRVMLATTAEFRLGVIRRQYMHAYFVLWRAFK